MAALHFASGEEPTFVHQTSSVYRPIKSTKYRRPGQPSSWLSRRGTGGLGHLQRVTMLAVTLSEVASGASDCRQLAFVGVAKDPGIRLSKGRESLENAIAGI